MTVDPRERQFLAPFLGVAIVGVDVDRALEEERSFEMRLAPGAGERLTVRMRRYANDLLWRFMGEMTTGSMGTRSPARKSLCVPLAWRLEVR